MAFPFIRVEEKNLGLKRIRDWREGEEPTEENVANWLATLQNQQPGSLRFRNYRTKFLLDWTDIDIPDPQYALRDIDLDLIAFPEVESPYKFPESIFVRDETPQPPSGFIPPSGQGFDHPAIWNTDEFQIKPPLFSETDLVIQNPQVEIRRVLPYTYDGLLRDNFPPQEFGEAPEEGQREIHQFNNFQVRIYSEANPSGEIPVRCVTHGQIHNLPTGTKLMVAPRFWMEEGSENGVFPPETAELRRAYGLGVEMFQYDDFHWSWYRWDDGDFWRVVFQVWFQDDRVPSRGKGFNMLLNNVNGMSLGGNNNKIWVDPVFKNNISKVNFHKMFREVSHCYKVDKCNFAQPSGGQVFKIFDPAHGFDKLKPSQLDGTERYCRYRQDPPNTNKISRLNENIDWDYFCKYLGIPQRAVEYDRNYKCLINDIVIPFRREGILHWTEDITDGDKFEEVNKGTNHYVLRVKSGETLAGWDFGQLRIFGGGALTMPDAGGTIPELTELFHYTVAAPTADPETSPETYAQQLADHKDSRLFAKVFQYNSLDGLTAGGEFEHWLVELHNDYISPNIRISEFEIVENFQNGGSPFILDERFRGFNNGGLRLYMVRNPQTGQWEPTFPWELAPQGFYNITGGNITTGGQFLGDPFGFGAIFGTNNQGTTPPTVINVPPVVAKGRVRAWGLPGEIINRNIVAWKQPTVVRWIHIQEIRDKLIDFSQLATGLEPAMQEFTDETSGRSGLVKVPTPNHILVGCIEGQGGRVVYGTGMVSNGDTPYSDIFLTSDILHARNLAAPMLSYKLTTGLPYERPDHFSSTIEDFMSRLIEPHHLSIQRFGYREPGVYTFMRTFFGNAKIEQDVSYDLWIPRWMSNLGTGEVGQSFDLGTFDVPGVTGEFIGFSPAAMGDNSNATSTNQIFRIFHPNGMGWWRDAGLLGVGIQWGTGSDAFDFGAKGNGFKQEGFALINFFRRNIPLDKEVVAAYLRLVPSKSVTLGSQMVLTAGGGRQWTRGNLPFVNVDFVSQEFLNISEDLRKAIFADRVEYEERIIFEEENMFTGAQFNYNESQSLGEAKQATETFMGPFNFLFTGGFFGNAAHQVTKPPGANEESFFIWQSLDPQKTLLGNTLQDIRVSVQTGNAGGSETVKNFSTAQRSQRWYDSIFARFLQGRHSFGRYAGLNTRSDYDEGGNVDSDGSDSGPFGGRGFGFACSSGGWAKDWRVFDVTDVARLAYAQDRFDANYITFVTKSVADLRLTNLLLIDREEPDPDAMPEPIAGDELADIPIEERVVEYTGDRADIQGMFLDPPTGDIADAQDANGFITLHVSLKQKIRPRKITNAVTGDVIEGQATEDLLRKNYIVERICVKVTGGEVFGGDPDVPENPNYFICLGRSFTPEIGKIQSGWRYIFSKKWDAGGGQQTFEHIFPEGVTEQFREIKLVTNADSIDEFVVDGRYAKDDPQIAPITSPPYSETHDMNRSIQEKIFGSAVGATRYTILPVQNPITKIYQVVIHPDSGATEGIEVIYNTDGVIVLDFDGKFRPFEPPTFNWEFIDDKWRITGGTYQYCSVTNSVIIPPANNWQFSLNEQGAITFESLAKLENVHVSILYQIGRGAKVDVLIEAQNTGPAYDVDPEAINTITASGLSRLKDPSSINPDFYGPAEGLIPYSVTNQRELQGGYVRGVMPSNGHAFFTGSAFDSPQDVLNAAWKTKCKGVVTFFGEPNMEIFGQIEVQAPAFVTHFDPVTGDALSNGFKNTAGLDETKSPNGGRKPNNMIVELQIGGGATPNPSGDPNDPTYRKKQAGFYPELYVFLRERVDWLDLGESTFGLTFDFEE